MMDNYAEARGTENSIWVLMYLISAIFVHLFGKYITAHEKVVVADMMREAFVVSVIYVGTAMEVGQVGGEGGKEGKGGKVGQKEG